MQESERFVVLSIFFFLSFKGGYFPVRRESGSGSLEAWAWQTPHGNRGQRAEAKETSFQLGVLGPTFVLTESRKGLSRDGGTDST